MAKQTINLGTAPTGTGGDTPRSAFTKAQSNFDELYAAVGGATTIAALLAALQGAGAFGRGNILGSVSQANGMPTGAVIERGSNSSGQYVRFADGTQICWGSSPGATANNAAAGGLYFSGLITVGFPIAFSATPVLSASTIAQTGAMSWAGYPATYGTSVGYLSLISFGNGATATLQWMAVGRWF
jgi:hypothetical protein